MDNLWDNLNTWLYGLVTALTGGALVLIRRLFTNEKQIALLKQELDNIKDDVKEMKHDIKQLISRNIRVDE